ncbi:hypothetical protein [Alienimonas californiensis]|uniref:Uncharacterized protein n=1 Tax=Alienimonas californiensis TaxID=2527989 RepID=A0A517PAC5_9PLAN|nr:hypothetical protein [Alienimonas californiensis]QDT16321.1 hypothetical protein CA12_24220 [Alienimonas californiensis]
MNPPLGWEFALLALAILAWGLFMLVTGRYLGPRTGTVRLRRGTTVPPLYARTMGAVVAAFGAYLSLFALGLVR